MSAKRPLRFTIHQTGDQKLIDILTRRLTGREFDFEYHLPGMTKPIVIENQKLSVETPICSIKLEYRDRSGLRCECLVFVVEDQDDLTIPVPNKMLDVDLSKEQEGILVVQNDDDEVYRFILHKTKN